MAENVVCIFKFAVVNLNMMGWVSSVYFYVKKGGPKIKFLFGSVMHLGLWSPCKPQQPIALRGIDGPGSSSEVI